MKKLFPLILFCFPLVLQASSAVDLEDPSIDVFDKASLRRGAAFFIQNCLSCHSMKHMRYTRIAQDLEMSDEDVKRELVRVGDKITDSLLAAADPTDEATWFGTKPPDLSVTARYRGADWVYTYLRSFYSDPKRPFGTNNLVFPDVAMPNVFWEMQGIQTAVFAQKGEFDHFKPARDADMSAEKFDDTIKDLVNFMFYAAEPAQLQRRVIGKYVILFLIGFTVLAYFLKKEYWKDIA